MNPLYDGKFFYEVKATEKPDEKLLIGPFDNIYYINKVDGVESQYDDYKFVQIIDGKPLAAFYENEIVVLDRKL